MIARSGIALGLVLLLFAGALARADEPPAEEDTGSSEGRGSSGENSLDVLHFIQQVIDRHITRFDKLTNSNLGKVVSGTNPWDEQSTELMESFEFQNERMMTFLEREKKDPATHVAWMESVGGFLTNEITNGGRTVYVWRCRLYMDKADLENAIEDQPGKLDYCRKDLQEAEKTLDAVDAILATKDPKLEDVDRLLVDLEMAKRLMAAVGGSLAGMRETIEERYGLETPVLEKKAETAIKGWEACGDAYPTGVIEKWKERVKAWAKQARKEWNGYLAVRKEFETAYEPVVKQTFLNEFKHLKDKQFTDVEPVAAKLRDDLRALRVKVDHRHMQEAEVQRLLDEDKKISAEEKKQSDAFDEKYGAAAERKFRLYIIAKTDPSLHRKMILDGIAEEKAKKMTEEEAAANGRAIEEKWKAIEAAAAAEEKQRKQEYEKDLAALRKMMEARTKRRAQLGLSPDFDR